MKNLFLIFCLFSLNSVNVLAQGEANNWTFGYGAGLDFNSGNPVSYSVLTSVSTSEGCATISDAAGNLLFYSDGILCWDKNHNVMSSASNLGGNSSSSQSAIIVKQPGSTNLYFVFTVDAQAGLYGGTGGLNYSIVDMNLNGGLGDVTSQNVLMLTPTTEKVTVTADANGTDYWIVTHEWDNNTFASFKFSATGVNLTPVLSSAGSIHSDIGSGNNAESIGYMKISSDGLLLGLACYEQLNIFELFSFNNNTGMVTGMICSDNNFANASGLSGPYGFSFSPDNTKAYVAEFGFSPDPSVVYQYDLTSGNSATILASRILVASSVTDYYGALQTGVDQKLYLALSSATSISRFDFPNNAGAACTFMSNAVALTNGGSSTLGLPDFYEGFFTTGLHAVINYAGCTGNDNLLFVDTVLTDPYTLHWDFGDLNSTSDTSNQESPTFNFPGPGSYSVTLTISLTTGGSFSFTHIITIGGALPITITNDTLICTNTSLQLSVNVNNATYSWSPSVGLSCSTCQNPSANPTQNTTYAVTVTTLYCTGTDSVIIHLIPPTIASVFNDTSICFGTSALLKASGGTLFKWWPNNELSDTTDQVVTATPTSTETYYVEVDGANGCPKDTASVVVTIWPLPIVDAGWDITLTEGEQGKLSGTHNGVSNIWKPEFGLSNVNILDPTFTAATSTTYSIYSTDGNGCINFDSTHVIVLPAFLIFPNGFSPNDDGRNDLFKYITRGVSEVQLSIYNRWGEQIFYTNEMENYWDGKFKGQNCPVSVYVYVAKAKTWSGRNIEVTGNVTIIK